MGDEPSCTLTLYTRSQPQVQPSKQAAPPAAAPAPHRAAPSQVPAASATGNGTASDGPHSASARSCKDPAHIAHAAHEAAAAAAGTQTAASTEGSTGVAAPSSTGGQLQPASTAASHGSPHLEAVAQIGCSPHNVVACQAGQQQSMLLGLSNDVDCAVLAVNADGGRLQAQHSHSIPALAYVAAGACLLLLLVDSSLSALSHVLPHSGLWEKA